MYTWQAHVHMYIYTQDKEKNYKKMICEFSNRLTSLTETLCHIYVYLSIVCYTLSYILFQILVLKMFCESNWAALLYWPFLPLPGG